MRGRRAKELCLAWTQPHPQLLVWVGNGSVLLRSQAELPRKFARERTAG